MPAAVHGGGVADRRTGRSGEWLGVACAVGPESRLVVGAGGRPVGRASGWGWSARSVRQSRLAVGAGGRAGSRSGWPDRVDKCRVPETAKRHGNSRTASDGCLISAAATSASAAIAAGFSPQPQPDFRRNLSRISARSRNRSLSLSRNRNRCRVRGGSCGHSRRRYSASTNL